MPVNRTGELIERIRALVRDIQAEKEPGKRAELEKQVFALKKELSGGQLGGAG